MKKSRIVSAAALLIFVSCFFCSCMTPKTDSGAYDRGIQALEDNNYEQAKEEFEKAADIDNRIAESYRGIGIACYEEGDYEQAVSMFDRAIGAIENENEEFETDVLLYKADSYYRNNEADEAIAVYKELETTNKAQTAYVMEGCVYLDLRNFEAAEECFSKSAEAGERISDLLIIYEAYCEVNLEADGAVYLKRAAQIEPESAEEYVKKGIVYSLLEDYQKAYECLNTAIRQGYDEAYDILGNIYIDQGDISAAKALYTDMIKNAQNAAEAYNGLAVCSITEGDCDSALVYISYGLDCCDDETKRKLLLTEIAAYENKTDFAAALKKTEDYLKNYPDDETAKNEYRFLSRSM